MMRVTRLLPTALLLAAAPAFAQMPPSAAAQPPSPLPVRGVALFTSGVSYIQREGEVSGDATVSLTFRTAQINDILKSLVLLDERGKVQPAIYAARDPVGRTLQSFAVDVTKNVGLVDLLGRLRGARVAVDTANKGVLTGQIVSVEQREEKVKGDETVTVPYLNLLGENGLASIRLDGEKTVRLLDERLNREFRAALGVLASGGDDQRRQVTLRFSGDGRRRVRVGYVMEAPLWKMSYRLVLSGGGTEGGTAAASQATAAKPYLQGWALVENTTDEDWNAVRLSLVSGRPVSFIQDLYQPLYLPRPVIPPDVVASPYPQTHGSDLLAQGTADVRRRSGTSGTAITLELRDAPVRQALEQLFRTAREQYTIDTNVQGFVTIRLTDVPFEDALRMMLRSANPPLTYTRENGVYIVRSRQGFGEGGFGGGGGGFPGGAGGGGSPGGGAGAPQVSGTMRTFAVDADNAALRDSVSAQAQGQSAGELFQYDITTPVTLPRQQAAMIPVIAQDIEGEKVSLFNADNGSRFPLNAVRVKNNTTLHLKSGPVTLFDDGAYAGDARMEDIPPGDSRLISYAVDLSVEGERQGGGTTTTETTLNLRRGVLIVTRRERQTTTYTLKSKAQKTKTVLVEHPFRPEFTLVTPAKSAERTASVYRFAVNVAPGQSETLKVVTERPISQTIVLLDADLNSLGVYATRTETPARVREALQEVVQRRRRVQELQAQAANREAEIEAIGRDQERIRRNMAALDRASALYKRYVAQLDRQESRIQSLRADAQRLRTSAAAAEQDLRAFVDKLDISG